MYKNFIFLIDLAYYPDEHYTRVISASNIDHAIDKLKEFEDNDNPGFIPEDRVDRIIEINNNGTYNKYTYTDYLGKRILSVETIDID